MCALFSLEVLHAGAVKGLKDGFHWTAGVIHSTTLVTSTPDYLSACDHHVRTKKTSVGHVCLFFNERHDAHTLTILKKVDSSLNSILIRGKPPLSSFVKHVFNALNKDLI